MSNNKNYYEILGVEKDVNDDNLKKAYRKLSLKYHPDRQQGKSESEQKEAEEKFKEINEAYTNLSDPEKRQQYDMFGTVDGRMQGGGNPFGGNPFGGGFGFDDVFEMFGGGRSRYQQQEMVRPGKNVQMSIPLDIEDIYCGCTKKVKYKRDVRCMTCHGEGGSDVKICPHCGGTGRVIKQSQNGFAVFRQEMPCSHCEGTGKTVGKVCQTCHGSGFKSVENIVEVTFPAGIQEGQGLEMPGEGSESKKRNGQNGSFIAVAKYNYDRNKYTVSGIDIIEKVYVDYVDAMLGMTYKLILPDKKEIDVHIKECTESGKKLVLRGKGIKVRNQFGQEITGDYYLQIIHKVPQSLSAEEKKYLEKIKKTRS